MTSSLNAAREYHWHTEASIGHPGGSVYRAHVLHTLLRQPTGIFYAQAVEAGVPFFDRRPASEHLWP
ncbi:hypothetical protein CMK11_01370 [Candidatus Poribacteria bacterium]|nr:hypothetical protein [Candidatus Poribacteria bacterium]